MYIQEKFEENIEKVVILNAYFALRFLG